MKKEKLLLSKSVIVKHKKLQFILQVITYIFILPFAVLHGIGTLLINISEFVGHYREQCYYSLLRIILKKELIEYQKNIPKNY